MNRIDIRASGQTYDGEQPHAKHPLRVLHIIPSMSERDGGASRAVATMERALSDAGVEVTTLTTDHGLGAQTPAVANGAHRIYAHKWIDRYKVAPGLLPHLMQAVGRHHVVHIHALFSFASTVAAWVAHSRRVPYVVRPLGTLAGYGLHTRRRRLKKLSLSVIEGPILRRAAAVHFTSEAELAEAEALSLPMRGVVIPLGVIGDDGRSAAPMTHEALAGRRTILFLSRIDPKKNLEALIDAVAVSPMLRSSCALLIAGDGEPGYIAALKARATAAGLSDRVIWLGHIDGNLKRAAFATADVFALPSFSENFGIAAVEALLAGVPCVLGAGVAIAREIEDGGAGLAVAPEREAIARALEHILSVEAGVARDMALQAKRIAERRFSAHRMAEQLVALYQNICGLNCACGMGERPQ